MLFNTTSSSNNKRIVIIIANNKNFVLAFKSILSSIIPIKKLEKK